MSEQLVAERPMRACEFMHRVRGVCRPVLAAAAVLLAAVPAAAQHAEEAAAHEIHLLDFFWPVVNFAILCWVLYYFLATPLSGYLAGRGAAIRKDLVDAATLKDAATAQLAELDRKMKALPGEIDALRERGRAETIAEEQRIAQAAQAERDRLVDQARREIDVQVRVARRALTEHAADLAVELAADRLKTEVTADDQARLVTRYLQQVKG